MTELRWAYQVLDWLTSPAVVPWVGLVAAVAAAMTVDTRTWLKSPRTGAGRLVCVALVWVVVAWLLGTASQSGDGRGRSGPGGDGDSGQGKGKGDPIVKGSVIESPLPPGTPSNVALIITFVPSVNDPAAAQPFACDVCRVERGHGTTTPIRAPDMHTFDGSLVKYLEGVTLAPGVVVQIKQAPFPGKPVLQRVADKVRTLHPTATVVFDE